MVRKSWKEKLEGNPDLPRIQILKDLQEIQRYGGERMLIASPRDCYRLMKQVPEGKLMTAVRLRELLAQEMGADFTCPLTVGIFINIAAHAAMEMGDREMPYWRTLKTDGILNEKFPCGVEEQRALLEAEGHRVIRKGKHLSVHDYQQYLF